MKATSWARSFELDAPKKPVLLRGGKARHSRHRWKGVGRVHFNGSGGRILSAKRILEHGGAWLHVYYDAGELETATVNKTLFK